MWADVCVVGIARTPMGGFLGALSSLSATQLGSIAIKRMIKANFSLTFLFSLLSLRVGPTEILS